MQNDSIFQNLSYLSISLYQIYGNRQNPAIWLTQIALKIIFREYSGPLLPKNRTFTKTPDQCLALSRSYLHIKKSEHIMIQLIKPFGKVYSSKGKFSEAQAHPIFSWLFTNQPKTDQTHPRLTNIYNWFYSFPKANLGLLTKTQNHYSNFYHCLLCNLT